MAIRTKELEGGMTKTWSDIGMMIERDGVRYCDAIDPTDEGRSYVETDDPIPLKVVSESDSPDLFRQQNAMITIK